MDELIFPSSPIISSLPLLSLFNQSTHHPVFGIFHTIKLTVSLVVCLCVVQEVGVMLYSGSCRYGDF